MGLELDKDIASTMTEEELAAINEPGMSEEELSSLQAIADAANGIVDDNDDDDDGNGAETETTGATGEAGKSNDAGSGDATTTEGADATGSDTIEGAGEVVDADPVRTTFKVDLPADYDAQVSAMAAEMKDIGQKFKDGDIDQEEYSNRIEALNERRDQLKELKIKADMFAEINVQTAEQDWVRTVNSFVDRVSKDEGIDYRNDKDKSIDLDLFVKRLADIPANDGKPMSWFLAEAHKRVKALHGISNTPPAKQEVQKQKPDISRKPPLDGIPKTLAHVPGSDGPGDLEGEFTDLDGLDGIELEDAIAKLSPAQRERYLKG